MSNVPLYYNEDKSEFAVLISGGFGAGWSTWEYSELAYDARIVEFWLAHKDNIEWMKTINNFGTMSDAYKEACQFFKSIGYEECPYMGGFADIHLEWVPVGVGFHIDEYDGAESLTLQSDSDYWTVLN